MEGAGKDLASGRQPEDPVPNSELALTQPAGTPSPQALHGFKVVFISDVKRKEQLCSATRLQLQRSQAWLTQGHQMTAKLFLNQSYFIPSYKYFPFVPYLQLKIVQDIIPSPTFLHLSINAMKIDRK